MQPGRNEDGKAARNSGTLRIVGREDAAVVCRSGISGNEHGAAAAIRG